MKKRADHTKKQKVLIIVGPTASGKSGLAIELAKRFDGEVISADSRQVYKGLDIGTGKVTKREMQRVPHHLLDVASPKKIFSAQDFIDHARRAIDDITARGKLPIIAGGTGFYIDALVGRIALADVAPDLKLRARLQNKTVEQLYALLQKKDPARAASMATPSERNNKVRLIRALEVASVQGPPLYKTTKTTQGNPMCRIDHRGRTSRFDLDDHFTSYDPIWIGIMPKLDMLDKKIRVRLRERLKRGMIAEAKKLHAGGLSYKRMRELGLEYGFLAQFLQKKISRTELEAHIFNANRRYARRQITYWKRNADIHWFASPAAKDIIKIIRATLPR